MHKLLVDGRDFEHNGGKHRTCECPSQQRPVMSTQLTTNTKMPSEVETKNWPPTLRWHRRSHGATTPLPGTEPTTTSTSSRKATLASISPRTRVLPKIEFRTIVVNMTWISQMVSCSTSQSPSTTP